MIDNRSMSNEITEQLLEAAKAFQRGIDEINFLSEDMIKFIKLLNTAITVLEVSFNALEKRVTALETRE